MYALMFSLFCSVCLVGVIYGRWKMREENRGDFG